MHDILLRNALIADPEADSLRTGDVAVEGGCIVEAIGLHDHRLQRAGSSARHHRHACASWH